MRLLLLFILGLAALSIDCVAESAACKDAETTAAMRTCENARYVQANKDLDAVYNGLMKELGNGQREKLRLAEQAWLQFRDKNADFMAGTAEGGTLAPLIRTSSAADMTEARVKELTKLRHR